MNSSLSWDRLQLTLTLSLGPALLIPVKHTYTTHVHNFTRAATPDLLQAWALMTAELLEACDSALRGPTQFTVLSTKSVISHKRDISIFQKESYLFKYGTKFYPSSK